MAKATVAAVRRELLEQLEARGAKTPYFANLIEQYCDFMEIARQLRGDIKKRGVTYEDNSSVGVVVQKNNPS
ncbi:MAG: P27 family phage terminase small subunit, partial [Oscillospiraceae bacterium]|nr:P27 family phage terminase small subunit [Oscillospiraceae bacterium]